MINVEITERSIRLSGHACRKEPSGIDRACTAVSALTCNLVNSLKELTGDKVEVEMESGYTAIIKEDELSEGGFLLMTSWLLGLQDLNREYNCIESGRIFTLDIPAFIALCGDLTDCLCPVRHTLL